MTSYDAPRSLPTVTPDDFYQVPFAAPDRAPVWPREAVPSARPPRATPTERNRYRTQVVERVARDAGYREIIPPLPVTEQRALREAASAFLKTLPRSVRQRVSSRDVRHLFSRWDTPIEQAFALSAVAAGKRRAGQAPEDPDA